MTSVGCRGLLVVIVAVALAGGSLGSSALAQGNRAGAAQRVTGDPLTSRLELMLRSMRIARDWHVAAPGKAELVAGAIEGLLARVDPEAEYYGRDDLRRISRFAPTGGAGVGIEVRREPAQRRHERRGHRVVATRDGSPAALAGIKAGDLITHVDGHPAGDIPHLVMVHIGLSGASGTSLHLTIERLGDEESTHEIELIRTAEPQPDIGVDEIRPGIARIRVAAVNAGTATAVRDALASRPSLRVDNGLRGLVLDLRSTAGESVEGASALADGFLDSGPVLRTVARAKGAGWTGDATAGDIAAGRPMIVLVDGGTAGTIEALAAALQGARRARIVGVRTAGRGALRTLVEVDRRSRKGAVRMTTERLLTPAGAPLDGKGVAPDVPFEQTPASVRCRTLDIVGADGRCAPRSLAEDGQLARALELLDEPVVAAKDASREP